VLTSESFTGDPRQQVRNLKVCIHGAFRQNFPLYILSVPAKRLAGKSVSDMSHSGSSYTLNLNSIDRSFSANMIVEILQQFNGHCTQTCCIGTNLCAHYKLVGW